MNKLREYIKNNAINIIITVLGSVVFAFLIFPLIINLEFIKSFLKSDSWPLFIGVTAIILILEFTYAGKVKNYLDCYRNSNGLDSRPILYLDYIVLFIASSSVLIYFQKSIIPDPSNTFVIFTCINLAFLFGWVIWAFLKPKIQQNDQEEQNDSKNHTGFSDEPIKKQGEDKLGRLKFIDDLYKIITSFAAYNESPFVFGLYGSWGEGKTSALNLLKVQINDKKDHNLLVIDFDPWHFKNTDAIINGFYSQIEKTINDQFILPDLKKTFIKYQKLITSGISFWAHLKFDPLLNEQEDLKELKEKIESSIKTINKKILIIIDDIDRLQTDEILAIFQLIIINANFKNIIFLLALDPKRVTSLFNEKNIDSEFLDKIIQYPISLPKIEQSDIDTFLFSNMHEILKKIKISKDDTEKTWPYFMTNYSLKIQKIIKTLRHAKKYLNAIKSTLPAIKNEVNLYDFLILEIIKVSYIAIYNDLWLNPHYYLDIHPFSPKEEKKTERENHLDVLIPNLEDKKVVISLLEDIFPEVRGGTIISNRISNKQRISDPEYFDKYFILKVPTLEVSDETIASYINLWNSSKNKDELLNDIENKIEYHKNKNNMNSFINKLNNYIETVEKEAVVVIINAIYKNTNHFSRKRINFSSEYDKGEDFLLKLIKKNIDQDKIEEKLKEIVINAPDLFFSTAIILNLKRGNSCHISVNIENLKSELYKRFKEYFITGNRNIYKELKPEECSLVIYQWATNFDTEPDNKKLVTDYIIDQIKKYMKPFLNFLHVTKEHLNNLSDSFRKIYDIKQIQEIVIPFSNDESLSHEERKVISELLELKP